MNQGLPKIERLKSRKAIEQLFSDGKTLKAYPLILVYTKVIAPDLPPVQIATSVSKRKFKLAVHRNKVKRQIRECYRKNKVLIHQHVKANESVQAMFIYVGKNIIETKDLEEKIIRLLNRLATTIKQ